MRVLIDECAPRALKVFLSQRGHDCLTVQETGWSGKQNGELLALAEREFQAFVTIDSNLEYQQNLKGRMIAVVILSAASNRLADVSTLFARCAEALAEIRPSEVVRINASS